MAVVAVTNRIPAEGLEALRAEHEVRAWEHEECISREECLRLVAGADAVVTLLTERVDEEFLAVAGPQLQVVANVAIERHTPGLEYYCLRAGTHPSI